jgi:hypothetical protein
MAGVLGSVGDHVQQDPACPPAGAGLRPGRRGQRVGGIEVGQVRATTWPARSAWTRATADRASSKPLAGWETGLDATIGPAAANAAEHGSTTVQYGQ